VVDAILEDVADEELHKTSILIKGIGITVICGC
jgi:hypothetical protein